MNFSFTAHITVLWLCPPDCVRVRVCVRVSVCVRVRQCECVCVCVCVHNKILCSLPTCAGIVPRCAAFTAHSHTLRRGQVFN